MVSEHIILKPDIIYLLWQIHKNIDLITNINGTRTKTENCLLQEYGKLT